MLNLTAQHKLGILQRLIVQQPVQFCPLCRSVAVLVFNGDTINGKGGAIIKLGFHPVGVHVVTAGKHFSRVIMVRILISFHLNGSFNDFEI